MSPKELSIRKSNLLYLILAITFTGVLIYFAIGPFYKTRVIFSTNFLAACALVAFFGVGATYSWFNVWNNKTTLKFNSEGIIHKKNIIPWKEIKSFKTINYLSDTIDSLQLVLTLSSSTKEYTIPLFGFDTDKQHIRSCITTYSNHSIYDEGHLDKN